MVDLGGVVPRQRACVVITIHPVSCVVFGGPHRCWLINKKIRPAG